MRHRDIDQTARGYYYQTQHHRTCGVASQPPSNHHQGVDDNIIDFPLFPWFVTVPDVTCRNWRENVTLDPGVTVSHSLTGTNNGSYKYFVVTRELFLLPR